MNRKLAISTLAVAVAVAGCDRMDGHHGKLRHGRVDTAAAANEVRQTEAGMLAAFKAKDAARLTSYYADDAIVATPGRAAAGGRDAIAGINGNDMKDPAFALDFTNQHTDVAASGDLAWTRGTFRVAYTDPATKRVASGAGNYVTVFRKQDDGSWKAVADYAVPGAAEASPTLPLPPPKGAKAGG